MDKKVTKIGIASLVLVIIGVLVNASLECEVVTVGTCVGLDVFRMSERSNAQAELYNNTFYSYVVCCRETTGIELGHGCDGVTLLHLFNQTNAHAELTTESNYEFDVCLNATVGDILYGYAADCSGYETCVASVSTVLSGGNTNLHVADCVTDPYATKICASATGDIIAPVWTDNSTNITSSTKYLDSVRFGINWSDNSQVDAIIFSWNGTAGGGLNNISTFSCREISCIENITETVNLEEGNVCWKWYANDTANNWGETDRWCFDVCGDIDKDGVCDLDEVANCIGSCVGQNHTNIPEDSSCATYYGFNFATGCWDVYCNSTFDVVETLGCDLNDRDCLVYPDINITCNGVGGTIDLDCSDSIAEYEAEDTECGIPPYKCNESVWLDSDVLIKRSYCNGIGECLAGNWEILLDCNFCEYCNNSYNPPQCEDFDTDDDNVCDLWDKCIGQSKWNMPNNRTCAGYNFNHSNGCWKVIYKQNGYFVNQTDCGYLDTPCKDYMDVDNTCDGLGNYVAGVCNYISLCAFDPDANRTACAVYFGKSYDDVLCSNTWESGCWDDYVANWDPANDTACCGDDVNGHKEKWVDDTNYSGCYEGGYIADPDDSGQYCNFVGEKFNGVSTGICDNQDEVYCWASHFAVGISQDSNCCCCGDDIGETWSLFTSGYSIDEVIVEASCQDGRWVERKKVDSTLYDIWTYIKP